MKRKIRLTESTLRKIVKESVKKVLNEGKNVNNIDDYFEPVYTDMYDPYSIRSYNPGNYFAKRDYNTTVSDKTVDDLNRLAAECGYEFDDEGHTKLSYGDTSEYYGNELKHQLRQERNMRGNPDRYGRFQNRNIMLKAAKLGIPVSVSRNLSRETLNAIMHDLKNEA